MWGTELEVDLPPIADTFVESFHMVEDGLIKVITLIFCVDLPSLV